MSVAPTKLIGTRAAMISISPSVQLEKEKSNVKKHVSETDNRIGMDHSRTN